LCDHYTVMHLANCCTPSIAQSIKYPGMKLLIILLQPQVERADAAFLFLQSQMQSGWWAHASCKCCGMGVCHISPLNRCMWHGWLSIILLWVDRGLGCLLQVQVKRGVHCFVFLCKCRWARCIFFFCKCRWARCVFLLCKCRWVKCVFLLCKGTMRIFVVQVQVGKMRVLVLQVQVGKMRILVVQVQVERGLPTHLLVQLLLPHPHLQQLPGSHARGGGPLPLANGRDWTA
jgi:hypothetical protein